jgi:hypothetical protein
MARLEVWKVRWLAKFRVWQFTRPGDNGAAGPVKAKVVSLATDLARHAGRSVSLRIFGKNGRIQSERTYPRGADPRRSRG